MVHVQRRIKFVVITVLALAIAGFLFVNTGMADRYLSFQEPRVERTALVIPEDSTLNFIAAFSPLRDRLKETSSLAEIHLGTLGDIYDLAEVTHDQVELIQRFIQKQNSKIDDLTALKEAMAFIHYSSKYNVPLDLAIAVANTESHFDPDARSKAGAAGIMQVTWKIHAGLLQANGIQYEEDLHDPEKGIAAGCLLISRYLKAYGSTQKALGRYYGGSASVYWDRVSKNLSRLRRYTQ